MENAVEKVIRTSNTLLFAGLSVIFLGLILLSSSFLKYSCTASLIGFFLFVVGLVMLWKDYSDNTKVDELLADGELVILRVTPFRKVARVTALVTILELFIFQFYFLLQNNYYVLALGLFLFVANASFLVFTRIRGMHAVSLLTTRRMITKTRYLTNAIIEIENIQLKSIHEVSVESSLLSRLINEGTIALVDELNGREYRIRHVYSPERYAQYIRILIALIR